MRLSEIQSKIQNAKELDFGSIFNQSIELFKKVWLQGLLVLIITVALMIPFYILMYLPLIALGLINPESFQQGSSPNVMLLLPFFFFLLIFAFYAMFVSFALKAAFFRICRQKDLGIESSDEYFYYFKKKYIGKILLLSLAAVGISLLAILLCVLPIIYVSVPLTFLSIVFAFNPELSVSETIKASFDLGNKKWLVAFGLIIVSSILAEIIGLLMCVVGIFVTASFVYLPVYFIYKDVVGFEDDNELNQLGKNQEF
jgi:hypothetical protein